MRQWVWGLMLAAVALGSFFYWGAFTVAGNRRFDEMDGIILYAARLLVTILGAVTCKLPARDCKRL